MSDPVAFAVFDKSGDRVALESAIPKCSLCLPSIASREAMATAKAQCAGKCLTPSVAAASNHAAIVVCHDSHVTKKQRMASARLLRNIAEDVVQTRGRVEDSLFARIDVMIHNLRSLNARLAHTLSLNQASFEPMTPLDLIAASTLTAS